MRGILSLTAEDYHGDPAESPSLSSSIAHLICSTSPKHAWAAHPRLNPAFKRQEEQHFDIGTAAHWLLLQGDTADVVTVVEADDWRTKTAKEQRDAARAAGRLPLLAKHWDAVQAMVAAAREQLAALDVDPIPFTDGKAEQTLVWEEPGGVICRSRVDWLRDDLIAIDDYKSAGRSANPEKWSRSLFDHGYDVSAAFYLRGVQALTGMVPDWRWVVQETSPPYALVVVAPGPDVVTMARKKVAYAINVWRRCLETGIWPAYPTRVCWAELPPWEETRWLLKEEREGMAA